MSSLSTTQRPRSRRARPARISPISISSLIYLAIIFVLFLQGIVQAIAFLTAAALLVFFLLAFYLVFSLQWNTRLFDPGLTCPQLCAAVMMMLTVFAVDCHTQFVLGPFLLVIFSQAAYRLRSSTLTTVSVGSMVAYLAIILLRGCDDVTAFRCDVMAWVVCTVTLPLVSATGKQIQVLRHALKSTRHRLQKIEEKAIRDELTGLVNRRQLVEELNAAVMQSNAQGSSFCLAIIDVDHFKDINDRHGHLIGDLILREFADVARNSIRDSDILGRYGGDEFMQILPDTELKGAVMHAERLRVHAHFLNVHNVMPQKSISLSIGVAQYRGGETADSLIERADAGLYRAKERGRNRVDWVDGK